MVTSTTELCGVKIELNEVFSIKTHSSGKVSSTVMDYYVISQRNAIQNMFPTYILCEVVIRNLSEVSLE